MCNLHDKATDTGWGDPIDLAMAGYNAGWGAVVRYRGVPPYPETTAYITKVRSLVDRYTAPVPAMPTDSGQAVWPLNDPDPITNGFGNRPAGVHYELGYHTGIDLNADRRLGGSDYGQPVRAARSGLVDAVSHDGPLGNDIVIEHPDGYYTAYAHLSQILVRPGQAVTVGQQIGAVGCSGMSSCGPHLHFEVRRVPPLGRRELRRPPHLARARAALSGAVRARDPRAKLWTATRRGGVAWPNRTPSTG